MPDGHPISGIGETRRLLRGIMTARRELLHLRKVFDDESLGTETEQFARSDREFFDIPSVLVPHRRDRMTIRAGVALTYRQGSAAPILHERISDEPWAPSPMKIPRSIGHASRRRCTNGPALSLRNVGATVTWAKQSRR